MQNIIRKGDTLIATPAKTYQWLKNGVVILRVTTQKYLANEQGDYSVRLGEITDAFEYSKKYLNLTGIIYNKKLEGILNTIVVVNGIKITTNVKGIRSCFSQKTTCHYFETLPE